ncbi:MAG: hypothetical protein V1799_07420 [bacterium]
MTLNFPFKISDSGRSAQSVSLKSQILMLLSIVPGTRLHDPFYGIAGMVIEQELMEDYSPERTLFIIQIQEKFARYVPQAIITDIAVNQIVEDVVDVNIFYTDSTGKVDVVVWQLSLRLT